MLLASAAAMALVSFSAFAQERVFRYATTGDILGLDPHMHNHGTTNAVKGMIYGALLHRKYDLSLEPDLAESWDMVDDVTWEFKLREGVTFHDGTPFTADDVLYSYRRITQDGSEMRNFLANVANIEKVDDLTIRIITKGPDPILLQNLSLFFIVNEEFKEANNAFAVALGGGTTNFANLNANGTGPYKLVEWSQDNQLVMVPNQDWWGHADRTDNIDRAIFMPIGNDATRVAAILSGEIDMMYPVPLQDVPRLAGESAIEVMQGPELRTIFLGFDQHRDELMDMPGTGKNPFKDPKVREAMYRAIDVDTIRAKTMRGLSFPAGIITSPGVHGYTEALDQRLSYDPAAAKDLLTQAGYPDGFEIQLDCPNDRYNNDEAICQAAVGMLARIGVKANLNARSKSVYFKSLQNKEADFYLLGWGVPTLDSHYVFSYLAATPGSWNFVNFSDKRLDELTDAMEVETDAAKRDAMIAEAWQILKDSNAYIPLHHQVIAWGLKDGLELPIIPNDSPQFRMAMWK
jgi:peptide/nickel transport system substrate-binding protein